MRPKPGVASAALAHRAFRRLWAGQAVSEVGDGLTSLALLVVVHQLAGTVAAIGTLTVITSIPQLLLGLHAGVLVDRWDRRRVMIVSDLVRAALVAGLTLVRDARDLHWLYALALGQAAAGVLFEPARAAIVPMLVPDEALVSANAWTQTTRTVGGVAGATAAGLLLAAPGGARLAFGLDAVSFLVSALALLSIGRLPPVRAAAGEAAGGVWRSLADGLRFVFSERPVRGLLLAFVIAVTAVGAVGVLFVPYLLDDLGASTVTVGVVRAAQMVGLVVVGLALATRASRYHPGWLMSLGVLGLGPSLALMGLVPTWVLLVPVLLFSGACSSAIQVGSATLLQQVVPDTLRGRVESALDTILTIVMMGAMALAGVLADRVGARAVFLAAGGVALAGGIAARAWLGAPVGGAGQGDHGERSGVDP